MIKFLTFFQENEISIGNQFQQFLKDQKKRTEDDKLNMEKNKGDKEKKNEVEVKQKDELKNKIKEKISKCETE